MALSSIEGSNPSTSAELAGRGDSGKSLRSIGREIAQEIERIFEAKVNPGTIKERARRLEAGTNVPPHAAPTPPRPEGGCTGCKITPGEGGI